VERDRLSFFCPFMSHSKECSQCTLFYRGMGISIFEVVRSVVR